jgi:CheY-like chemotaxis protein
LATKLILIVDNDSDFRSALGHALTNCGFDVAIAANGLQALQMIAKRQPSLVLLDMHMPVLDGVGFAQRLAEYGRQIPIIVMSAWPMSKQQLHEIQPIAFIQKPFDLEELLGHVEPPRHESAAA